MREKVEEVIASVIRPLIEADGGTIELVSHKADTITVRLRAACAGCPGIHYTKAHVIEPALRQVLGARVHVVVEREPVRPRASDPG